MKLFLFFLAEILFLFSSCSPNTRKHLESGFATPPDSLKLQVYWYWMNEHVSKEGITKDLEAMARVGIGEVYIGNIYEGGEPGDVLTMSDQWLDCMQHAIREGHRVGVTISVFNGPGWSQSGGPWVKPEDAMRYLIHSDTTVEGGRSLQLNLRQPVAFFQDVATLAYPLLDDTNILQTAQVNMFPKGKIDHPSYLFDGNRATEALFRTAWNEPVTMDIRTPGVVTARSLTIIPTHRTFCVICHFQIKEGNEYRTVKKLFFDRNHTSLQLGPQPYGDLVMDLGDITGQDFRIWFEGLPADFQVKEVILSSQPKVEYFTEKSLNKLPSSGAPWHAYKWNTPGEAQGVELLQSNEVINLSDKTVAGRLSWDAPKGKWKILRIGMTTTGTTNVPAAPAARGLEIDKMSTKASQSHYNAYVGRLRNGLPEDVLKAMKRVIIDSYEVGPQNWTDDFRDTFTKVMGYDPIPWLPVLTGEVIGNKDQSDRFLWDMRRMVAEMIAENYVGGTAQVAHENGMELWLENYGHWGFPSEFGYYGKFTDGLGGEFWAGTPHNPECRIAASTNHIYGKNKVYSESYTAGENYHLWYPDRLKQKGDWSYTEGVNQVVMHVYIHQPYEDKVPGINSWFGIEFNRHNTWFEHSKAWIDYQRRCCFMLQQGIPQPDVAYFVGEDSPVQNGWLDWTLSTGYEYDFINADAIETRLDVKNGKFVLPNGIEYGVLVLPPLKTMRPKLATRIKELVEKGGVVLGAPPVKSPSLSKYPECDSVINSVATALWGKPVLNDAEVVKRQVGKGWVYTNVNINEILKTRNIIKDLDFDAKLPVCWEHRKLTDGDVYFLSNQGNEPISTQISFRVKNKIPEYWDATTGEHRKLINYTQSDSGTLVPLSLASGESCFIVFLDHSNKHTQGEYTPGNTLNFAHVMDLQQQWDIHFSNKILKQDFSITSDSLFDWSTSAESKIRYFSGEATYSTTFEIENLEKDRLYYMQFEKIGVMAKVLLNGKELQTVWTYPYRANLTQALKEGKNQVDITVANLWVNHMVQQASLPMNQRDTWTLIDVVGTNDPLHPSGLIGTVSVVSCVR